MIEEKFVIVAFSSNILDIDFGLVEARDTYFQNRDLEVYDVVLSEVQVCELQDVFDIINDLNSSMIGIYEDDVIYSRDVKIESFSRLKKYEEKLKSQNKKDLVKKILNIFQYALLNDKNIYFLF